MHEIKSFKIFQTAKVVAVMYAVMFAIFGGIEFLAFMRMGPRRPSAHALCWLLIRSGRDSASSA